MLAKIKVFTLDALENEFGHSQAYLRAFVDQKFDTDLFTVNGEKLSGNVFRELICENYDDRLGIIEGGIDTRNLGADSDFSQSLKGSKFSVNFNWDAK